MPRPRATLPVALVTALVAVGPSGAIAQPAPSAAPPSPPSSTPPATEPAPAPTAEPGPPPAPSAEPAAPATPPREPPKPTAPANTPSKGAPRPAASADARAAVASKPSETTAPEETPAWQTAPAERRGGFAIGVAAGGGFGAANGFPNDSKKIGYASAYTETGIGAAFGSNLWIGGALADWLTFGFGAGFSTIASDGYVSESSTVFFHTDVYPLYPVGGILRDLGVSFDFGTGAASAKNDDAKKVIDGAGPSFIQTTVFLEALPFWQFRLGPFVGEHYTFSASIRRPVLIGGLRLSLYTSP